MVYLVPPIQGGFFGASYPWLTPWAIMGRSVGAYFVRNTARFIVGATPCGCPVSFSGRRGDLPLQKTRAADHTGPAARLTGRTRGSAPTIQRAASGAANNSPQSAIDNRQSTIENRKSTIRNRTIHLISGYGKDRIRLRTTGRPCRRKLVSRLT